MYSYRRLNPTRQTYIPPAPPSPPLGMPNSDLDTDAYAEDKALDGSSPRGFGFPVKTPCRSRITLPTDGRQRVMDIRRGDTY